MSAMRIQVSGTDAEQSEMTRSVTKYPNPTQSSLLKSELDRILAYRGESCMVKIDKTPVKRLTRNAAPRYSRM